ncbi:MAG: TonB-dependent receptor, partial [Alphaproteobacteria bacterium]|nr:TonB-dependent receptor [Alphaproteobacteria bacterium]
FGSIPFNTFAPADLGSVRIIRGGGAAAEGAGALTGVVAMESRTRADLPLFNADAAYGSRNGQDMDVALAPDLGNGFAVLSGHWERGDGYYTTPQSQRVPANVPARYDDWSTSLRTATPLDSQTSLSARIAAYDDHRTLRFSGANSAIQSESASLRLLHHGRWQVDADAYVQAQNYSGVVISATTFKPSLNQRNTPSTGVGGKLEVRSPRLGNLALRFGVNTRAVQGNLAEDAFNAKTGALTAHHYAGGDQVTFGSFGEGDLTLGALTLTGAARLDHWSISNGSYRSIAASGATTTSLFPDRNAWEGSGRLGGLVSLGSGIKLRAAAYTGYRIPTLNELYRVSVVFPVTIQANAVLAPERLEGAEAGVTLTPDKGISIDATTFTNRLGNAIANVTIGTNLQQRRNVRAIMSQGLELDARAVHGPLTLTISYSHNDARVEAPGQALDGHRPAQTPKDVLSASLLWHTCAGAEAGLTLRYLGQQFEDDLSTSTLPGAWVMGGEARLPLNAHLQLTARVENLLNQAVITRNASGSIDLGQPQTFWIGASAHF